MRLDPELARHRYERKISFAGILDDEDGHDSLNSSSHTLKSDTTGDDKKPPEAQGVPRPRPRSSPPPRLRVRFPDVIQGDLSPSSLPAPIRKIRIGGSRLLQIKGARSFRVKKGGSLSSIRRAGSLKSTKLSRQDSESENEEGLLSQTHSRDTVTDIGEMFLPPLYRNVDDKKNYSLRHKMKVSRGEVAVQSPVLVSSCRQPIQHQRAQHRT